VGGVKRRGRVEFFCIYVRVHACACVFCMVRLKGGLREEEEN